jgi:hypothetical protein
MEGSKIIQCKNTYLWQIQLFVKTHYRMFWNFSFVLTNPLYSVHFNEHLKTVLIYSSTDFSLIHLGKKLVWYCMLKVAIFNELIFFLYPIFILYNSNSIFYTIILIQSCWIFVHHKIFVCDNFLYVCSIF